MFVISISPVNFRFRHIFSYVVSSCSKFCHSDDISSLMFPYFVLWDYSLWHFVLESRARDPGVFGPDVNSHFTVGTLEALFGPKFRIPACFLISYLYLFLFIFIFGSFVYVFVPWTSFFSSYSFFSFIFRHFHCRLLLLRLIFLIAIFAIVDDALSVFAIFGLYRCLHGSIVSISMFTRLS